MKKLIIIFILLLSFVSVSFAEDNYILPDAIRTAIIEYLIKQPYEEVAAGVQALMTLKKVEPEKLAPEPKVESPKP
jgi:hypothetical protein